MGIVMSRKTRRVPVNLDPGDVKDLSEDEIRIILRGADELIMSGGRGLLAKVLKGSRQKVVFEHDLDRSPVYGALSDLSLAKITQRIDWLIINDYLRIEHDNRLPLLVYSDRGWAIEKETYADELLERLDPMLEAGDSLRDLEWLTERNPKVLTRVLEKIAERGDAKYLAVLERWQKRASRRMVSQIRRTIRTMG